MAEREKYEQWLRELEAKRESTPDSVFTRVHADYSSRLKAVAEQLRKHTKSMQEHAGNLMAKLRELEASEKSLREQQAESEIRKQVGELSTSEFDSLAKKAQREITRLRDDQERIAHDLNRIRSLLGVAPSLKDEDMPRTSADFDELEFLKSVVGANTPPTGESSAAAAASPNPLTPTPAASTPGQTPPTEGPLALRSSGATEQPKTLKCAECGSMNYASEWYCERCGAELAAI